MFTKVSSECSVYVISPDNQEFPHLQNTILNVTAVSASSILGATVIYCDLKQGCKKENYLFLLFFIFRLSFISCLNVFFFFFCKSQSPQKSVINFYKVLDF